MSAIQNFLNGLSSTGQDVLLGAFNELSGQAAPGQIAQLEAQYETVREEIRLANEKRDTLRRSKEGIEGVLAKLEEEIVRHPDIAELRFLKALLCDRVWKLEEEIASRQPYKSLRRKARLRHRIDQAKQFADLLNLTGASMRHGK